MKHFDLNVKHITKGGFCCLLTLFLFMLTVPAEAQYFGQNKVRYKNLKFEVNQSPHFELYYYLKNDSLVKRFMQESELWYDLHQQVFRDTFAKKNPLILYNNHADFQQTTAISGSISVGTGGVTEGLKNRVVMPMMQLNQQTRHVLGHELVHAFQYHSLIEGDSTNLENIGNLPLWMVEGMAEYLSIGKVDAFTAMWMRDAYLNKDIPTLRDLTESNKYFPYRYGQAFWSYIGSTYGDTIIVPFFKATAKFGYQNAIRRTFGYDERTLSSLWRTSIENTYRPMLKDTSQVPVGRKLIDNKNGGEMNVAPAISPDGKYVAFLSEKELFSIDLFLADAETGRVIRKLTSRTSNTHIDEFSFIESAGAWSPDSKKFAFTIFAQGRNKLMVVDISNGKLLMTESLGDVREFSNLAWSPNGEDIALTGLQEGYSDLYIFNTKSKKVTQLTDDRYSDYQPSFSPDGKYLLFTSDRTTLEAGPTSVDITYSLAVMDLATKAITNIDIFHGANNLNPQFSSNGEQIFFLSNRDGFRNLYRYTIANKQVEQLTDYFTGISGITEYSPALSVSRNDDVLYSYYRSQKYTIYNAKVGDFKPQTVDANAINFDAATLPPLRQTGVDLINANLRNFERFEMLGSEQITDAKYRPQFKLDYLASNGVGASVGRFGTGLSSGVQGIFSDILGRNQIYATAAVNGEIHDFGAQLAYINQQGRVNFGASISHIPYLSGFYVSRIEPSGNPKEYNYVEGTDLMRTFEDQVQLFGIYPFSRIFRFEAGVGAAYYSYRIDRLANYFRADVTELPNGELQVNGIDNYPFDSDRRKLKGESLRRAYPNFSFDAFTIYQVNAAFVGDNSFSGVTSPLSGFRFRVGIESYIGDYTFNAFSADLRRYYRIKPVTLAGRFYSYTRFGKDQTGLYPLFIGYPYLIRGYESSSLYANNGVNNSGISFDQLSGSKIAVANFEVRLPFTGPEKLAAVESKFLFSDLNLFFDIGIAYNQNSKLRWKASDGGQVLDIPSTDPAYNNSNRSVIERIPAMSAGISLRVNMFGYFVLEPYYAFPFQRKDIKAGVFGLTFAPGW